MMVNFQIQYTTLQYQPKLSTREREITGGEKVIQDLVIHDRALVAGMILRFSSFQTYACQSPGRQPEKWLKGWTFRLSLSFGIVADSPFACAIDSWC